MNCMNSIKMEAPTAANLVRHFHLDKVLNQGPLSVSSLSLEFLIDDIPIRSRRSSHHFSWYD